MIFGPGVTSSGGFGLGMVLGFIGIALAYAIPIGILCLILSRPAICYRDFGYRWWAALIPYYNAYLLFKKSNKLWMFWLLMLVELICLVMSVSQVNSDIYVKSGYGMTVFGAVFGLFWLGENCDFLIDAILTGAVTLVISHLALGAVLAGMFGL